MLPLAIVIACQAPTGSIDPARDGLHAPFFAHAGGVELDVGGHAAPLLADFDGDGLDDLLVGQHVRGSLIVARNEGTCSAPRFAAPELVRADGQPVYVPPG